MHTDSSASFTYLASASASECTATVLMPSSRQARWMRSAISPRLAIRIFLNMVREAGGGGRGGGGGGGGGERRGRCWVRGATRSGRAVWFFSPHASRRAPHASADHHQ